MITHWPLPSEISLENFAVDVSGPGLLGLDVVLSHVETLYYRPDDSEVDVICNIQTMRTMGRDDIRGRVQRGAGAGEGLSRVEVEPGLPLG